MTKSVRNLTEASSIVKKNKDWFVELSSLFDVHLRTGKTRENAMMGSKRGPESRFFTLKACQACREFMFFGKKLCLKLN